VVYCLWPLTFINSPVSVTGAVGECMEIMPNTNLGPSNTMAAKILMHSYESFKSFKNEYYPNPYQSFFL